MITHEHPTMIKAKYFTPGTIIIAILAGLGAAAWLYRMFYGLGAATNLDNQYPWGMWIAIDVACGVALAAGGFTTAALADIFHKEEYHVITRPALLTALLGYTFVAIGVMTDLGRFYNIWHPIIPGMWQGNSVLFEVGLCVMTYLTVLYIEFMPIVAERFIGRVNLPGILRVFNGIIDSFLRVARRTLGKFISVFIIAGVVLSCLHQSSLGTLMIVAQTKLHVIWNTPLSPLLFLMSAIAVGFPMVVFESILAARSFKLTPERKVLSSISKYIPLLLGAYCAVRIGDLTIREVWPTVFAFDTESIMFLIEFGLLSCLPVVLLSFAKVRQSLTGLFVTATMVVFGVALNRINVFLIAYEPLYPVQTYIPHIVEFGVTIGFVAMLVLLYRFVVINFPVLSVEHTHHEHPMKPAALDMHGYSPTTKEVDR